MHRLQTARWDGLSPSHGSGLVSLDEDGLALLKLTDINTQKLKVVQSRAGEEKYSADIK